MFIGLYLILPGLKSLSGFQGASNTLEVDQIQLFVGGAAVIWALKGTLDKLRDKKEE